MRRRDFCGASLIGGAALSLRINHPAFAASDVPPATPTDIPATKLSGQSTTVKLSALDDLAASLRGTLILPTHPDYEDARRIWNGMIDKRPAMIVRCASAADVAKAVMFARERELVLAVRGGGHSYPGYSTCDGGMVIDLSPMRTVRVDVRRRTATAAGGAWGRDVDFECQHYGLATPMGQISDTGIAGLTLGGGFGWLSRRFGLACDNLVSMDLVTADGELRRVSADENPDLNWALRGGGGNFGVVTSFGYRLHPVGPKVLGGRVVFPIEQARDVIEFFAELTTNSPRELSADLALEPDDDGRMTAAIYVCWSGDIEPGRKVLAPLLRFGSPLRNTIEPQDYLAVQRQFDGPHHSPKNHYLKGGLVREFTPGLIDALVDFRPTGERSTRVSPR